MTKKQEKKLKDFGFTPTDEKGEYFCMMLFAEAYVTEDAEDEFTYDYDWTAESEDSDLLRANYNKTEHDLSWDELVELLKKEGFKE